MTKRKAEVEVEVEESEVEEESGSEVEESGSEVEEEETTGGFKSKGKKVGGVSG